MKHSEHCTCGASMTIAGSKRFVDDLIAIWKKSHSGPGHQPVTAKDAYRARVMKDIQEALT